MLDLELYLLDLRPVESALNVFGHLGLVISDHHNLDTESFAADLFLLEIMHGEVAFKAGEVIIRGLNSHVLRLGQLVELQEEGTDEFF